MAYDLTKLVKVSALQQLAQKVKDNFYDKTEIEQMLAELVKTITVGNTVYEANDQNITLPTIIPSDPSSISAISVNDTIIQPDANGEVALSFGSGVTPNTFIVNNQTVTVPAESITDATTWTVT